jgi:hypothetical protein
MVKPAAAVGVLSRSVFERTALARFSRATFLRRTAMVAGGAAAFGALDPLAAFGGVKAGDPRPIPGGFLADLSTVPSDPFIHVLPPVLGYEMSTITDFDGVVAAAEIQGTASDNKGGRYWFDCDMRFMKGRYVDLNGRRREGVFGFV